MPAVNDIDDSLISTDSYCRYLNQQHIKTNQLSEAELIYGNHQHNDMEQMEIGELGKLYVARAVRIAFAN